MSTYRPLTASSLIDYLATHPALATRLGGGAASWTAREVSDGNLNTVFIVSGPAGSMCCKQSLPYVRVDPAWAMPLERNLFEARWMQSVTDAVGRQIPALYHLDEGLFLIVMENLATHHVLRTALIAGTAPAGFAARIGEFVGRTGFATSWRALPFKDVHALRDVFSRNLALTRITVDLVLTDPYQNDCARNRWLSPELDDAVASMQGDAILHAAVERLQERFLSTGQALLHGDLHTGSVMINGDDVRVIDGEFSLYGPIGFDIGMFIANLVMNAYAQPEHDEWMRDEIALLWSGFKRAYLEAWKAPGAKGDLGALTRNQPASAEYARFFQQVMHDAAGFAGLEMIRRTIGFAQIDDYDSAPDRQSQVEARRRALTTGRGLIQRAGQIGTIEMFLDHI
ncbi:S-methyl-5-thioribose kinase [Asaia bogorensis]|uniref:S-methyl-5-thioribose kinase n=1 Tax=Asaia bogorensis NBRC 16594 TaxID=1231624 RepID=A0AAN4R355_9PROT|nr:S-methyl-5-thioribose kinase [Asaia bogorensis]BAT19541.1 methylthioribose kinase [Asaia bogorensis NBRC 16594]GBQ78462.1 methylthioribose kinase [Asaia bogorensis NBRC 16594]GEL53964.1 methylthioribose kinase [Asaia bogorensis NBRC 16594]